METLSWSSEEQITAENKNVNFKDTDNIIHVMDIEGDVSKDEIEDEIRMNLSTAEKEHIGIVSTRPNWSGGQMSRRQHYTLKIFSFSFRYY